MRRLRIHRPSHGVGPTSSRAQDIIESATPPGPWNREGPLEAADGLIHKQATSQDRQRAETASNPLKSGTSRSEGIRECAPYEIDVSLRIPQDRLLPKSMGSGPLSPLCQ